MFSALASSFQAVIKSLCRCFSHLCPVNNPKSTWVKMERLFLQNVDSCGFSTSKLTVKLRLKVFLKGLFGSVFRWFPESALHV